MENLQNVSGSRQESSLGLCLSFEDSDLQSDNLHPQSFEDLDPTSLSILKEIGQRGDTKAKELIDLLHLSRGPILGRLKKLSEKGFLVRSIQPGTEQKSKPTYIYRLSSSQSAITKPNETVVSTENQPRANSIEVMAELLEAAIQEIAALKSRMVRLETALEFKMSLDREELLSKLKS